MVRRLALEALETRRLLASTIPPIGATGSDVSQDGYISRIDALQVINAVHRAGGPYNVTWPTYNQHDVNGDNWVSLRDAIHVINDIGKQDATPRYFVEIQGCESIVGRHVTAEAACGAIYSGMYRFESAANINFVATPPGEDPHLTVVFSSGIGNIRGLYYPGTDVVYVHSGQGYAPGTVWGSYHGIAAVFVHESLHWLGFQHVADPTCVIHSNTSPTFCEYERGILVDWWGESQL